MMKANLLTKLKLAKDTMQFDFALPEGELVFKAGQYLSIKLPKVRPQGDEGNVRYFSIASSPEVGGQFSITTRLSSSAFKQGLFGLSLGAEVEVGGVAGNMMLPQSAGAPLVFVAGGIGITPFMSMLVEAQAKQLGHKITLLYANRNRSSAVYVDELQKIAEDWPDFQMIMTMTDDEYWPGEKRAIDYEFIKEYVPDYKGAQYFVAGPPAMVLAMANNFDRLGITKDHFFLEEFFGY